jgi:hypothetical protein
MNDIWWWWSHEARAVASNIQKSVLPPWNVSSHSRLSCHWTVYDQKARYQAELQHKCLFLLQYKTDVLVPVMINCEQLINFRTDYVLLNFKLRKWGRTLCGNIATLLKYLMLIATGMIKWNFMRNEISYNITLKECIGTLRHLKYGQQHITLYIFNSI